MRFSIALACAGLWGCTLTTPGVRRAVDFQAVVDDQVTGGWPVAAIAPNTAVTVRVMTHEGQEPLLITEWWVEEPSVLSAERDGEDRLRVLALAPGTSRLWVRAGYTEDLIEITVVQPVAIDVLPPFSIADKDTPLLAALVGQPGELPIVHRGPNREHVLALGVMPEVVLEPAELAKKIAPGPRSGSRLQLSFEQRGRLSLVGGAGPTVDVAVLDLADVSEVLAEPAWKTSDPSVATFHVKVGFGGLRARLITGGFGIDLRTPEVCGLADEPMALEVKRLHGPGAFTVVASAMGRCEGVVKLAELSVPFAVELTPKSEQPATPPTTRQAPERHQP